MWQPWSEVYPEVRMQPGAAVRALWRPGDKHLDLFATGTDGAVWSTWWDDLQGWRPEGWLLIHPEVRMQPGAAVRALWRPGDKHLDLFATGTDGAVWSTWWDDVASPSWGLLSNSELDGRELKATFFFAGSSRDQPQAYELPTGSNRRFYTLSPLDDRHLQWHVSSDNQMLALDMMSSAGINTVAMSYWGERGSDRWAFWAPMQTSTHAHDELFTAVVDKPIKIMPVIEGGAATYLNGGQSPVFQFRTDFASGADDTSPYLTFQIVDLVQRYLLHPEDPRWPSCWTRVVDRDGSPRFAIMLMHVASDVIPPGDHRRFAAGVDRIARSVFQRTGMRVGFMLDVLPAAPDDQCSYYLVSR